MDETLAGTDMQQNSTMLPSILPAMNSIQSNEANFLIGGKSSIVGGFGMSPHSNNYPEVNTSSKFTALQNAGSNGSIKNGHLAFQIGNLN
jgi:hypothetical protein